MYTHSSVAAETVRVLKTRRPAVRRREYFMLEIRSASSRLLPRPARSQQRGRANKSPYFFFLPFVSGFSDVSAMLMFDTISALGSAVLSLATPASVTLVS